MSMSHIVLSRTLNEQLERLSAQSKAQAIAVAVHDLESGLRFSLEGDRWFHAASTIKVAVLLALFRAADEGRVRLDDSLHVRNRFISAADASSFHLDRDSDAMPELYQAIGRTAKISALAEGMIAAGLPAHAAVAHKTGEISTACHDMGIVYLPEREPYIAVILTEFDLEQNGRRETVAAISEAIYRSVMGMEPRSNEH